MLSNTTRTRQLTVDSWKLVSTITWKHNKKLWVSFLKRPQFSQSVLILLSGIPPHYVLFFGKDPPSHCFPWHGPFVWNCKMRSVHEYMCAYVYKEREGYPISFKLGHVVCSYMWYIFISCNSYLSYCFLSISLKKTDHGWFLFQTILCNGCGKNDKVWEMCQSHLNLLCCQFWCLVSNFST